MKPLIIIFLGICCLSANAQIVDTGSIHRFYLKDSTLVTAFPGFLDEGQHTWYYLPTAFRLSVREEATPEFSFLIFSTEEGEEASGAILNFLLVWGLNAAQEAATSSWIQENVDSKAVLMGPISLEIPENEQSFNVIGKGELADLLRNRMNRPAVAPVISGTKVALSYRLNAEETTLFEAALKKPEYFKVIFFELVYDKIE